MGRQAETMPLLISMMFQAHPRANVPVHEFGCQKGIRRDTGRAGDTTYRKHRRYGTTKRRGDGTRS